MTASLAPGTSQGEALEQVRRLAEEILPAEGGHRVGFSGESEQFFESGQAIVFAYLLGIAVIYNLSVGITGGVEVVLSDEV